MSTTCVRFHLNVVFNDHKIDSYLKKERDFSLIKEQITYLEFNYLIADEMALTLKVKKNDMTLIGNGNPIQSFVIR